MLRISVELYPGGDASRRRPLGFMNIGNVSPGDETFASYEIYAGEAHNPIANTAAWTAVARVDGHDRRQSVWRLIAAAARALDEADRVDW